MPAEEAKTPAKRAKMPFADADEGVRQKRARRQDRVVFAQLRAKTGLRKHDKRDYVILLYNIRILVC